MTSETNTTKYIESVGRRKEAVARVRIFQAGTASFLVNGKDLETYFPTEEHRQLVRNAFSESGVEQAFAVSAHIKGGGVSAQAEALRHGIARGLTTFDPELRKKLKKIGFLKRDPRQKERRKFGLKKARKAPQWSKR